MRNEFAAAAFLVLATLAAARADVLITPREAKLPDIDTLTRGVMSGPRVIVVAPARDAGAVKSPFALRVRFEPRAGAPVDLDTFVVVYEKSPPVDLTERVRPYVSAAGIDMPVAEAPPGEHRLRIEIKDVQGRVGGVEFVVKSAP